MSIPKAAQKQEFLARGPVSAARLAAARRKTPYEVNLCECFPCPSAMQCLGRDRLCRNPGVACVQVARKYRYAALGVNRCVGGSSSNYDVCIARVRQRFEPFAFHIPMSSLTQFIADDGILCGPHPTRVVPNNFPTTRDISIHSPLPQSLLSTLQTFLALD